MGFLARGRLFLSLLLGLLDLVESKERELVCPVLQGLKISVLPLHICNLLDVRMALFDSDFINIGFLLVNVLLRLQEILKMVQLFGFRVSFRIVQLLCLVRGRERVFQRHRTGSEAGGRGHDALGVSRLYKALL